LITSGDANGDLRRVARTNGYTALTGTATPSRVFSAQIASGVTFEIHRYDPRLKNNGINDAIRHAWPHIHRNIVDESLVVDDRLSNSDFENLDSGSEVFASWTAAGSPTVTASTTVKHGARSASVVASGAAGQLTQTVVLDIAEIAGKNIQLTYWAQTSTTNAARVRIDFGSATESGDYITGDGSWRKATLSTTVPTAATQVVAILEAADGSTVLFDAGWLIVGAVYSYTVPSTVQRGPVMVLQQAYADQPEGPYHPISSSLSAGRRLQLHGIGTFDEITTDAATLAIEVKQERALSVLAAGLTFESIASSATIDDVSRFEQRGSFWRNSGEALLSNQKITSGLSGAQGAGRPHYPWYWTEADAVRTLTFPSNRTLGVTT